MRMVKVVRKRGIPIVRTPATFPYDGLDVAAQVFVVLAAVGWCLCALLN